jgi:hypothetical protein
VPFGALKSNVQHHYYEQWLYTAMATQVAQGTSVNFNIGSPFTMPWPGDIIIDGYLNMVYDTGATVLNAKVEQATSIAATNFWPGVKTETCGNGGWIVIPCFGRWASLAEGTLFQLTIKVTVGAVNGRAIAQQFAGSLRAQAA